MHVDPGLTPLAFRDFQRLKLKYDVPLSNVAFNSNLRPYTVDVLTITSPLGQLDTPEERPVGRGGGRLYITPVRSTPVHSTTVHSTLSAQLEPPLCTSNVRPYPRD